MARARRSDDESTTTEEATEPAETSAVTEAAPGASEGGPPLASEEPSGDVSGDEGPEILGRCDVCPGRVIRISPKGESPVHSYCPGCGRTDCGWLPLETQ